MLTKARKIELTKIGQEVLNELSLVLSQKSAVYEKCDESGEESKELKADLDEINRQTKENVEVRDRNFFSQLTEEELNFWDLLLPQL